MALKILDHGRDNVVVVAEGQPNEPKGTIEFHGNGNWVEIGATRQFGTIKLSMKNNCHIRIGRRTSWRSLQINCNSGARVEIGFGTAVNGGLVLSLGEPSSIRIGRRCLLADGVAIATSDHHGVYDLDSGLRLNHARSVTIGDHVWLGFDARILKGAAIGRGCIVGARSVVGGRIEPCCAVAGNPAKVIRRNVGWNPQAVAEMPADRLKTYRGFREDAAAAAPATTATQRELGEGPSRPARWPRLIGGLTALVRRLQPHRSGEGGSTVEPS